jgi:hypothetical protein
MSEFKECYNLLKCPPFKKGIEHGSNQNGEEKE